MSSDLNPWLAKPVVLVKNIERPHGGTLVIPFSLPMSSQNLTKEKKTLYFFIIQGYIGRDRLYTFCTRNSLFSNTDCPWVKMTRSMVNCTVLQGFFVCFNELFLTTKTKLKLLSTRHRSIFIFSLNYKLHINENSLTLAFRWYRKKKTKKKLDSLTVIICPSLSAACLVPQMEK